MQVPIDCQKSRGGAGLGVPVPAGGTGPSVPAQCYGWQEQVQVVDLSNGGAKLRGKVALPMDPDGYEGGWGWGGFYYSDWYTLYTTHTEWVDHNSTNQYPTARYYLDRIDLTDLKHPKVGSKINVPGVLVGGDASDPTLLYTIDYRWDGDTSRNDFDVVKVSGDRAYLQSKTAIDGWVGNVIVRGATAYMSSQIYPDKVRTGQPNIDLHQIDLSNPQHPSTVSRATRTGGDGCSTCRATARWSLRAGAATASTSTA